MRAFRKWLLVSFDIKYSSSTRRFAITVFFSHFARAQLYSFSILFWWYFFLCSFCTLYQLIILIAIPLMSSSHSVSGFSDASCFWTTTNLERDSEFFTIHQNDVMIWCRSLLFFFLFPSCRYVFVCDAICHPHRFHNRKIVSYHFHTRI